MRGIYVSLGAVASLAALVSGQSGSGSPAFEAASVKPNKSIDEHNYSTLTRQGGHVAIYGFTLRQLIAQAYDFSSLSEAGYAIFEMPRWGDSDRFDIDAESPNNPTIGQKRLMLQSLLAERFKLVVRHENRQMPAYALVAAKPGQLGPQLRPHRDDVACQQLPGARETVQSAGAGMAPLSPADAAMLALQQFPCGRIVGGLLQQGVPNPEWAGGRKVTMEAIAESLGGDEYIDRPVVDRTGLTESFDFTIEWNTRQQDLSVKPEPDSQGLSLFEAVRRQLGLKVESTKIPVGVLVVVYVERPPEN
jgi:uncharacterized protein (TIGR03435 family)